MDIVKSFIEENSGETLVQKTGLRIMSSTDRIRQIIRHELSEHAARSEHESFEDADDFEFEDGEEWVSPYEEKFDPPAEPSAPADSVVGSVPPSSENSGSDGNSAVGGDASSNG